MAKPKLLYLVHRIPYPPNKGDKIRSFHFLQALSAEYQIFLGTFIDDQDDWQFVDALKAYCGDMCCIDLNPKLGKIKSLTGFLGGTALSLPYYRNRQLQAWVDNTVSTQTIERVMIFSSPMAQYVEKYASLHWVADFVDVDSDKWQQYAASKTWPASWVYRREAEKLLAYERRIASQASATLFVSEQEAALFKSLAPESSAKIGFVNNGVDIARFDPALEYPLPFANPQHAIVFTGAMDYWANVDAVKWFAEQVFPLVKTQLTSARFYIVGSKPTKDVLALADSDSGVVVTGRVDDVRPYLAHAKVVVAPLRIARGIQNKVLEAMAMAKPVVVTSAGMEGIAGGKGLEIKIADLAKDFAEHVLRYITESAAPAIANRQFVERDFSWHYNGQRLCRFLAGEAVK